MAWVEVWMAWAYTIAMGDRKYHYVWHHGQEVKVAVVATMNHKKRLTKDGGMIGTYWK